MKRNIIIYIFLLVFVFSILGCKSTIPYFYSDNSNREFILLGDVTYVGKIVYLGPFGRGNATFQLLLKEAQLIYEADYVINITIDKTTKYNIFTFLGFWTETYTMKGMAIRYIKEL